MGVFRRLVAAAFMAAGAIALIALPGARGLEDALIDASPLDCLEPVPAPGDVSVPAVTDGGQRVAIDVRVLLDGVSQERAAQLLTLANRSYSPLRLDLRAASYQSVALQGSDAQGLIDQAKALVAGPGGADVVHVFTAKSLTVAGHEAVDGHADCVGGVRFPSRAFSVSEAGGAENLRVGPATLFYEASAKVAAHEIGHLLGGQHHMANCAEGVASELEALEPSPCSVMFNDVTLASFPFSTPSGAVVRGHAINHAAP